MPHYTGSVDTPRSVEEAFDYMKDFSNVSDWDPSIEVAEQVTPGEIAVGTEFRIVVTTAGSEQEIRYIVTEIEAPRRIKVRGENEHLVSVDEVRVEPDGAGSKVTYDAELELKGARKLAHPLVSVGFKRNSDQARSGLAEQLGGS